MKVKDIKVGEAYRLKGGQTAIALDPHWTTRHNHYGEPRSKRVAMAIDFGRHGWYPGTLTPQQILMTEAKAKEKDLADKARRIARQEAKAKDLAEAAAWERATQLRIDHLGLTRQIAMHGTNLVIYRASADYVLRLLEALEAEEPRCGVEGCVAERGFAALGYDITNEGKTT